MDKNRKKEKKGNREISFRRERPSRSCPQDPGEDFRLAFRWLMIIEWVVGQETNDQRDPLHLLECRGVLQYAPTKHINQSRQDFCGSAAWQLQGMISSGGCEQRSWDHPLVSLLATFFETFLYCSEESFGFGFCVPLIQEGRKCFFTL